MPSSPSQASPEKVRVGMASKGCLSLAGRATLLGTPVTGNGKSSCCLSPPTRNVCCQGAGEERPVHLPRNAPGTLGTWAHSLLPVLALEPQGNIVLSQETLL